MGIPIAYRTILAGTDLSALSLEAVRAAAQIANVFGAERLHVVQAVPHVEIVGGPLLSASLQRGSTEHLIEAARAQAAARLDQLDIPSGRVKTTREVIIGAPIRALLAAAESQHADLIVVATHGRSAVGRFAFGSVASGLVRAAKVPVLVVGHGESDPARITRVMAAIDFSPISNDVLEHAATFALRGLARLDAFSCYEEPVAMDAGGTALVLGALELLSPDEHWRALKDALRLARLPPEIPVEISMARGHAAHEVLRHAARSAAGLVVIGTSGHNFIERAVLGSTATRVLSQASCPVLVIPNRPS